MNVLEFFGKLITSLVAVLLFVLVAMLILAYREWRVVEREEDEK